MNIEKISKYECPLEAALSVIGGKYKVIIIWYLMIKKVIRFNELNKLIGDITPKVLSQQLKDLEMDNIVEKKVYPVVPPKTEYQLTPFGETLIPLILSLHKWGLNLFDACGITDICDDHELIEHFYDRDYEIPKYPSKKVS